MIIRKNQKENDESTLDKIIPPKFISITNKSKDEKLQQNEELAGLRAGVSLAKQQMADASKIHDFGRNFKKK